MKKILIRLVLYAIVISAVFYIFAKTHDADGLFTTYNIMSGLACGGLAVIVIFGFLGKKGDKPVVNFLMSIGFGSVGSRFTSAMSSADNMMYSGDPQRMMKSIKPQLDTKPVYVGINHNDDSRLVKTVLALLPYVVGLPCMAVGLSYLMNITI